MRNFIRRVLFPSYKRTIGVLVALILVLAIPITIKLVGQQQDIRQRASEETLIACSSSGQTYSCVPGQPDKFRLTTASTDNTLSIDCPNSGVCAEHNSCIYCQTISLSNTDITNKYYLPSGLTCKPQDDGKNYYGYTSYRYVGGGGTCYYPERDLVDVVAENFPNVSRSTITSDLETLYAAAGPCCTRPPSSSSPTDTSTAPSGGNTTPGGPLATTAAVPSCNVSTDKTTVAPYTTANITLNYQNVTSCTGSNGVQVNISNPSSVSFPSGAVPTGESRTYSYSCTGTNGATAQCGSVTITASSTSTPPTCTPTTSCAQQGKNCGTIMDGCTIVACGNNSGLCTGTQTCNNGVCTTPASVPPPSNCNTGTSMCQVPGTTACFQITGSSCSCYQGQTLIPCTPTAPPAAPTGDATLSFTFSLPGTGLAGAGRNTNPFGRNFEVAIFNAQGQQIKQGQGSLKFDQASGTFKGDAYIAGLATSSYSIKARTEISLWKLLPGIQTITPGTTNTMPAMALVSGDIVTSGISNNTLDLSDYNLMISCIKNTCDVNTKPLADLNGDGKVDEVDLNILYAGFANRNGD